MTDANETTRPASRRSAAAASNDHPGLRVIETSGPVNPDAELIDLLERAERAWREADAFEYPMDERCSALGELASELSTRAFDLPVRTVEGRRAKVRYFLLRIADSREIDWFAPDADLDFDASCIRRMMLDYARMTEAELRSWR